MKQFKQSQKIRIIISGVGFYTTVKDIRNSMFCFTQQNQAAQMAVADLEQIRNGDSNGKSTTGIGKTYNGLQVQLDLL